MLAPGRFVDNLPVDGALRATWWVEREGRRRTMLAIRPVGPLRPAGSEEVHEQARRVLDVLEPHTPARSVRLEPPVRAAPGASLDWDG